MSGRQVTIVLTQAEANHVLRLLDANAREGSYTAPRKQYWDRHARITLKVEVSLGVEGRERP